MQKMNDGGVQTMIKVSLICIRMRDGDSSASLSVAAQRRQRLTKMLVVALCNRVSGRSRPCRHYVTDDSYVISGTLSISTTAV